MAQWLSERDEPGKRLGEALWSVTAYPMLLTTRQPQQEEWEQI